MNIENDKFSLSQKDRLVAEIPRSEIPLVARKSKKTLLERPPLSNTTSAMMRIIRGVLLSTEASQQRIISHWSLKNIYKHVMTDTLYRNSLFSMASTFVMGGLGFVFWVIIARLYKTEKVGIATSLISITTLLSGLAILGLNSSLNRHLPKSVNKNELINSSFVIVTIATLLPCVIFFLGLQVFSPHLFFLRSNLFYLLSFIIFTIFISWNNLVDSSFMAYRAAGNILIKNIIIGIIKLVLPFALIAFGAYGIFASNAVAYTLGALVGLFVLSLKFNIRLSISVNISLIKEHSIYSLANYIVIFIRSTPGLVLPVILLNVLSAKYAAYSYIALQIQNLLLVIPIATEQALLAEGSHNEADLKKHVKKALATVLIILLPATAIIVLFGNILLQFFGKSFAIEAFQFLQLISISTVFYSLLFIASAIMNIKHDIKSLVILNIIAPVSILSLSYAFVSGRLVGIGWGWMLGQAITGVVSLYFIIRNYSETPSMPGVAEQGSEGT